MRVYVHRGHLFPRNPLRPSDDVSLAREARETGVLSLSYPPGAVSPSSLSLLPLVPLRSYQRRILPCSTCLSRVQDSRRSGADEWRRKRAARSRVKCERGTERIYERERNTRERALRERKGKSFVERAP